MGEENNRLVWIGGTRKQVIRTCFHTSYSDAIGGVMYQKVDYLSKPCMECSKEFKPKTKLSKFCSSKCKDKYRSRNRVRKKGPSRAGKKNPRKYGPYKCKSCKKQYMTCHKESKHYCSRECSDKNAIGKPPNHQGICILPAYSKVYAGYCEICGGPITVRLKRTYCSNSECVAKRLRDRTLKSGRARQRKYTTVTCISCGVTFSRLYGNKKRVCSYNCEKEQLRKHRRIAKAKRRARIIIGEGESFDPYSVFRRDIWKCKVCGCNTPVSLRGTLQDNAPELDHIIPLSKGGEHTMANTQCLCRICNGLKSDKTMEVFVNEIRGMPLQSLGL